MGQFDVTIVQPLRGKGSGSGMKALRHPRADRPRYDAVLHCWWRPERAPRPVGADREDG